MAPLAESAVVVSPMLALVALAAGLLATALYSERYCLFLTAAHALAGRSSVTWAEAAREPLCLLTPNMQNRRIIDRAFLAANAHPSPKLETNSIMKQFCPVLTTTFDRLPGDS